MSMNKYISGIINCLDTVPSLKKQLVRAFKKVEEDTEVTTAEAGSVITGATVSTDVGNHITKQGKMVTMALKINSVTADAYFTLCTIPEGYRPAYLQSVRDPRDAFQYIIDTDGNVKTVGSIANKTVNIYDTWITK